MNRNLKKIKTFFEIHKNKEFLIEYFDTGWYQNGVNDIIYNEDKKVLIISLKGDTPLNGAPIYIYEHDVKKCSIKRIRALMKKNYTEPDYEICKIIDIKNLKNYNKYNKKLDCITINSLTVNQAYNMYKNYRDLFNDDKLL